MDNTQQEANPSELDSEDLEYNENRQTEQSEENSRFSEGQELRFIRVRFPGNARSFPFHLGKQNFVYGQKVVAMSDRGMDVGYINSFPYQVNFKKEMLPIKNISKLASEEDIQEQKGNYQREKDAEKICLDLVEKHKLDMNITHVEFTQFGKKAVFYFNAPHRVDFRGLVRDLVGQLKMRIELRQISVRDRAAAIGGIGPCGLQLCCSSFLTKFGHVNIRMAKNQNLTLIQSKLNGVCGQLKCCTKYEDQVYTDLRSVLPKENSYIETKNKDRGKVLRLFLLERQFEMITDQGAIKKYSVNQFLPDQKLPDDWSFPERFEHVARETGPVIGQEDYEKQKIDQFKDKIHFDLEKDKTKAFQYFNFLQEDELQQALSDNTPEYLKEVTPTPQVVFDPESKKHKLVWPGDRPDKNFEELEDEYDDYDDTEMAEDVYEQAEQIKSNDSNHRRPPHQKRHERNQNGRAPQNRSGNPVLAVPRPKTQVSASDNNQRPPNNNPNRRHHKKRNHKKVSPKE